MDGDTGNKARMTLEFYNNTTLIATMYVKNSDDQNALQEIIYDAFSGIQTSFRDFIVPDVQSFQGVDQSVASLC